MKRTCLFRPSIDGNIFYSTVLLLCLLLRVHTAPNSYSDNNIGIEDHELDGIHPSKSIYTNQFVIQSDASPDVLKRIAYEHGFDYVISVSFFFSQPPAKSVSKKLFDFIFFSLCVYFVRPSNFNLNLDNLS